MGITVQILGASSATPTATRHPSAQVLDVHDQLFLIDCGEGTQMQLRRFRIKYSRIRHIFISHLHGDHYLGLAGLIFTLHLFGRKEELHVYGNTELKDILDLQLKVSATTLLYPLIFHPLEPGQAALLYEDKRVEVSSFPLQHRVPTHGFLFREKPHGRRVRKDVAAAYKLDASVYADLKAGRDVPGADGKMIANEQLTLPPHPVKSYAYCSDTGASESYLPYIRGVDVLYHEATFMADKEANAREKEHSTTLDAAKAAIACGARKLIIGHYSARYDELEPVLAETRTLFAESYLAEEGIVFEI